MSLLFHEYLSLTPSQRTIPGVEALEIYDFSHDFVVVSLICSASGIMTSSDESRSLNSNTANNTAHGDRGSNQGQFTPVRTVTAVRGA